MGLQQLRIYISTDDRWFAKHWLSEFKILYQEQGIFRTSRSTFISHSSRNFRIRFNLSGSKHVDRREVGQ